MSIMEDLWVDETRDAPKRAATKTGKKSKGGILPTSRKGPEFVRVPGLEQDHWLISIVGLTPLVMNRLSDAASLPILQGQYGGKYKKGVKKPKAANPLEIFAVSIHQVDNCAKPKMTELEFPFTWFWDFHKGPMRFKIKCRPGFPTVAVKKGILYAASLMDGVSEFWVSRGIHVQANMISIEYDRLMMERIDSRTDKGVPIQSYLPAFHNWKSSLVISAMRGMFDWEGVANLVSGAGKFAGLGKQRPEKGGQFGAYMIDTTVKMTALSDKDLLDWIANHRTLHEEPETKVLNLKEIMIREKEEKKPTKKVARKKGSKV